jgi:hypothetical protein
MRTITTTVYSFDELNDSAKKRAIENIREQYYRCNDFSEYVIDDCYLLEPRNEELSIFSEYKDLLIKNNRKVYYSLDRDRHIDISKAMEIQDSRLFLKWLGLDDDLIDKVDYDILKDDIEFSNQSDDEFTDDEMTVLCAAEIKFREHCQDILNCIEKSIDYCFSDESIIEDIYANLLEFTDNGEKL